MAPVDGGTIRLVPVTDEQNFCTEVLLVCPKGRPYVTASTIWFGAHHYATVRKAVGPTVLPSWMPIPHRRGYVERYGDESIVILDYDPAWSATFEQEHTSLHTAVGPLVLAVEHIGSTAVPGFGCQADH
jgi:hypothetical protein